MAALCKRVVVIAQGQIQYDGSLDGIIDGFSNDKIVTLELGEGQSSAGLEAFGVIEKVVEPKVSLRCKRTDVFKVFGSDPR